MPYTSTTSGLDTSLGEKDDANLRFTPIRSSRATSDEKRSDREISNLDLLRRPSN